MLSFARAAKGYLLYDIPYAVIQKKRIDDVRCVNYWKRRLIKTVHGYSAACEIIPVNRRITFGQPSDFAWCCATVNVRIAIKIPAAMIATANGSSPAGGMKKA